MTSTTHPSLPVPAPQAQGGRRWTGGGGTQTPSHCDYPTAPFPPMAARAGSPLEGSIPTTAASTFPWLLQELPVPAPVPHLYMEMFSVACTAEDFGQLTIAISEITLVVSGSQNKRYLPNWFTFIFSGGKRQSRANTTLLSTKTVSLVTTRTCALPVDLLPSNFDLGRLFNFHILMNSPLKWILDQSHKGLCVVEIKVWIRSVAI